MGGVSNGGAPKIASQQPYAVEVEVTGTAALLFHAWNSDSVEAKGAAAKGSAAKKTDDLEAYVYRDGDGLICLPGEYLRQAVIAAAKFKQDPRSPRKSAMDLFKAGVVPLTDLAPIVGAKGVPSREWDYLDRRRVRVQQNAITRIRPAYVKGWKARVQLQVLTPEYIDATMLHETVNMAGRLIGVADFRPTFGRFGITHWEVLTA